MLTSTTFRVDSSLSTSCSGICFYGGNDLKTCSCRCSSPDTSLESPVYVAKLAKSLQLVVQHNDTEVQQDTDEKTCFHCLNGPAISIRLYVQRIARHSKCSPVCFIMAWSYLKRLAQSHPELAVTSLTVHRLVITAVMLAVKLMDDKYFSNAYYAKIGGIALKELNQMELEMLRMLEYRTFVSSSQVKELLHRLDAFLMPGHLVSILCRKRSCSGPSCSPDVPASPMHKPKVAKSHIAAQQLQHSDDIPEICCDTDQTAGLTGNHLTCPAATCCGVVCENSSPMTSNTPPECSVPPCAGVVDVCA